MVRTVFAVDVVDDLLSALVAEVHIEIRHTDALGVQKALEDQIIADGVDIRDAHTVGSDTARTGAASRPHRDTLTFCKIDIVPHDEVVVGITHRLDHADLVFQAVDVGLRHVRAIAALQAIPAELFKVGLIVHAVRGLVIRDLGVAELKVKIALLGDFSRIGTGFRHHGEQLVHLVGGLDVEFIGLELHAVGILNGLAGLDAQQDALHLGVLFAQIMGVVGGCYGDARLPGKLDELRQNGSILLQAVILQFDVVILCTEQVPVPQRSRLCALVVPCQNGLRDLARQTGRKADQSLVVLLQKLLIHAWLGIKALHKTGRDHFDQVLIAGLVFAQQDQMVVAVYSIYLIKAGAGGNIDFAPDDGLDTRLFSGFIKLHTAVHHAVVGAGNGGLSALLHPLHQLVDTTGAVQQAVFRMDMQVGKGAGICGRFTHCTASCPSCWR